MRRTSQKRLRRVLLSALWMAAGLAAATAVVRLDLEGLTDGADAVVHARVLRVESRWTKDRRQIVTDVELAVLEALKGAPGKTVVVQQPGGQVGEWAQVVSGLARFEPGEEVVLFLERGGGRKFALTGLAQGKFKVERTTDGKGAWAFPEPTGDAALVDPATGARVPSGLRPLELGELKRRIRARVKVTP